MWNGLSGKIPRLLWFWIEHTRSPHAITRVQIPTLHIKPHPTAEDRAHASWNASASLYMPSTHSQPLSPHLFFTSFPVLHFQIQVSKICVLSIRSWQCLWGAFRLFRSRTSKVGMLLLILAAAAAASCLIAQNLDLLLLWVLISRGNAETLRFWFLRPTSLCWPVLCSTHLKRSRRRLLFSLCPLSFP